MGLFKKNCFHCNQSIGLFGGTKIANTDFCNNCTYKFTQNSNLPYLNRNQFAYPDKVSAFIDFADTNKSQFQQFNSTRCFKEKDHLYIDEKQKLFYVVPSLTPIYRDISTAQKSNGLFSLLSDDVNDEEYERKAIMDNINFTRQLSTPIVFSCKSITDIRVDIHEKRLDNNRSDILSKVINAFTSTITFSYDYSVKISLNHCWVSDIKLQLNQKNVIVTITQKKGVPLVNPREQSTDCQGYEHLAGDIKTVLENLRTDSPEAKTVAIKCPYCGAPSIAYEGTTIKCEYCGSFLNA